MEVPTMGKVLTAAKVHNLADLLKVREGHMQPAEVRTVSVEDALVDTGATMLSMPRRLIDQLGLQQVRTRTARTAAGTRSFGVFDAVQLNIGGRECVCEVAELPDDCPVLIGQIPLEMLDWVVDPIGQRLIGNPEHGGEQMIELYSVFD